ALNPGRGRACLYEPTSAIHAAVNGGPSGMMSLPGSGRMASGSSFSTCVTGAMSSGGEMIVCQEQGVTEVTIRATDLSLPPGGRLMQRNVGDLPCSCRVTPASADA